MPFFPNHRHKRQPPHDFSPEGNNPNFHDRKRVKREWGKTKPSSNQLRTALQIDWATMHLRRIWSTHPSAFKHMGHALTTTLFRCCKLSKVRIAPRRAIHRNTITPGGAFNFQMLEIELDYLNRSERTEKKDATEKRTISRWHPYSTIFSLLRNDDPAQGLTKGEKPDILWLSKIPPKNRAQRTSPPCLTI